MAVFHADFGKDAWLQKFRYGKEHGVEMAIFPGPLNLSKPLHFSALKGNRYIFPDLSRIFPVKEQERCKSSKSSSFPSLSPALGGKDGKDDGLVVFGKEEEGGWRRDPSLFLPEGVHPPRQP